MLRCELQGTWRWSSTNEVFYVDGAPYGDAFSNFRFPPSHPETSSNCATLCHDLYDDGPPIDTAGIDIVWDTDCSPPAVAGVVCEYGTFMSNERNSLANPP